ncbi:MAG: zinc metalloprotease HtpX [Planctomycetota bacterium JB042]
MDAERLREHRRENLTQTLVLLGGLALLLAGVGHLVLGPLGVVLALAFTVGVAVVGPTVSTGLVLRLHGARPLSPASAPELHAIVAELSRRAGLRRAPTLHYVPTRVLNAFATGRRDDAVIAVTDGLLRALDGEELAAVLAHEIGHVASDDLRVMNLAAMVTRITGALASAAQFMMFLLLPMWLFGGLHVRFLGFLLLMLAPTVAALLQLALSRSREFDADLEAAELTGRPEWLARALRKMERLQAGWFERIFVNRPTTSAPSWLRTHPTTEERVERLLRLVPPERVRPLAAPGGGFGPRGFAAVDRAPRRRRISGVWI